MSRTRYVVREIFDTLQGEGARAGSRAVFVRFAGCNLWDGLEKHRARGQGACARWCDTDFAHGDGRTVEALLAEMGSLWPEAPGEPRWAVLTGGEPTLQVDAALIDALHAAGWSLAMETNGTVDPEGGALLDRIDHLCVSPKIGGELKRLRAHELKVVVPGVSPGNEAAFGPGWDRESLLELAARGRWDRWFVQPMDDANRAAHIEGAVQLVRSLPGWRLSLQTHKWIGLR